MTCRIERVLTPDFVVLRMIGRIDYTYVATLLELVSREAKSLCVG